MPKRRKTNKSVTQQVKSVNDRYKKTTTEIDKKQERVLTSILISIQSNAAFYTPQDTNALINSQYRRIQKSDKGLKVGRVGYTQEYAAALHGDENYTPLWKPAPPGTKVWGSKGEPMREKTNWNANATPRFLERGANESKDEIKKIIKSMNRL
jgi:hypothetical protein